MAPAKHLPIVLQFPGLFQLNHYVNQDFPATRCNVTPEFLKQTCRQIAGTPVKQGPEYVVLKTQVFLYLGDYSPRNLDSEQVLDIYKSKWDLPLAQVVRTSWENAIIYAFFVARYREDFGGTPYPVEIYSKPDCGDMQPLVKKVLKELYKEAFRLPGL